MCLLLFHLISDSGRKKKVKQKNSFFLCFFCFVVSYCVATSIDFNSGILLANKQNTWFFCEDPRTHDTVALFGLFEKLVKLETQVALWNTRAGQNTQWARLHLGAFGSVVNCGQKIGLLPSTIPNTLPGYDDYVEAGSFRNQPFYFLPIRVHFPFRSFLLPYDSPSWGKNASVYFQSPAKSAMASYFCHTKVWLGSF